MSRKSKFEDEKNRLDIVRNKLDEAIADAEEVQQSNGVKGEYIKAIMYQGFVTILRNIKLECGEEKPKEGQNGCVPEGT